VPIPDESRCPDTDKISTGAPPRRTTGKRIKKGCRVAAAVFKRKEPGKGSQIRVIMHQANVVGEVHRRLGYVRRLGAGLDFYDTNDCVRSNDSEVAVSEEDWFGGVGDQYVNLM
jgi:hypothetical protein